MNNNNKLVVLGIMTAILATAFSLQITAHSAFANSNQVKINNHGSFSCGNGGNGNGGDANGFGATGGNGGIGGAGGVCSIG